MLRNIIVALGVLLFAGGLIAWLAGTDGGIGFMILGAIFVLGTVFERTVYKSNASKPPGPGWQKTTERFVDDQTGKPVTVYIKPETGERVYVEE